MIEYKDLKDGMEVWFGAIDFNTRGIAGTKLTKHPNNCFPPEKYKITIQNYGQSNKIIKLISVRNEYSAPYNIYSWNYGRGLYCTLYSTREELVSDWNMIIQSELDRRANLFRETQEFIDSFKIK